MVKRVGRYEVGKTLGEGTFGKVKYAVNTETGEKVRRVERARRSVRTRRFLRVTRRDDAGGSARRPLATHPRFLSAGTWRRRLGGGCCATRDLKSPTHTRTALAQVAIKILDKEKIQKQNMGSQIKKEVGATARLPWRVASSRAAPAAPHRYTSTRIALGTAARRRRSPS